MRIVIGGMIRSGSTFSFNIAREVLLRQGAVKTAAANSFPIAPPEPEHPNFILKTHAPDRSVLQAIERGTALCICTIRKPEDAIASWIRTFGFSLDDGIANVKGWLAWYSVIASQTLTIEYQTIDQFPERVIADVDRYITGTCVDDETRVLAAKYNKAALKETLDALSNDLDTIDIGFSYYDKETFFHRRHISSVESRGAETELNNSEIARIRNELSEYVDLRGELRLSSRTPKSGSGDTIALS